MGAAATTSRACMGLSCGLNTEVQLPSGRGQHDELAPFGQHGDGGRVRAHRTRNDTVRRCVQPLITAIDKMQPQDVVIERDQAHTPVRFTHQPDGA